MLASIRRLTKSRVGAIVGALFLAAIVASFAMADITSVLSGGTGLQSNELARVGSQTITDRDMDRAMQRRLTELRQSNPEADYSSMSGEFDQMLAALIDEKTLNAFGEEHGFNLSKRLVDAEIASLPGARGLDGKFSEQAYQGFLAQQRLTDSEVRQFITSGLLQRLLMAPVAANARAPVGMARPYASMLLEQREGQVAFVPIQAFRQGLNPSDAQLQKFYTDNRRRYTVPQQRVLRIATIGPEQVAGANATEKEIADYYRANQAQYAAKEIRVISQAVVPDQTQARAIATRARGGSTFVAAAAPAGLSAEDVSVGPQTREEFTELAGAQVAAAAFQGAEGAIVGPVQSPLGWHVVKIDDIQREGGRSLDQVRGEIAARLNADKRKEALTDLVTRVEDQIADGASLTEAAASAKLKVIETPLITASGTSLAQPGYTLPEELRPALKAGFELGENDEPVVETLPDDSGYLLVGAARVVAAEPAPLARIRDRVAADWITAQATARARKAANDIAARAAKGSLTDAVKGAPAGIRTEAVKARRIQLSQFQGQVPAPLAMLFSLSQGKSRMVPGTQGEGFYIVQVDKIMPGNALTQPALISQTQQQMQDTLAQEYALQFLRAVQQSIGVSRNEKAIAEAKRRIVGGGN